MKQKCPSMPIIFKRKDAESQSFYNKREIDEKREADVSDLSDS